MAPAALAPAAVESASSVEAPSTESSSMETAKTGLSPGCVPSSDPAMRETTESAGMHSGLCVRDIRPMKCLMPGKTSAVRIGRMVEVHSTRTKTIAVDDRPAMRNVRVVVVDDSPTAVPIESPIVPSPAEAAK